MNKNMGRILTGEGRDRLLETEEIAKLKTELMEMCIFEFHHKKLPQAIELSERLLKKYNRLKELGGI